MRRHHDETPVRDLALRYLSLHRAASIHEISLAIGRNLESVRASLDRAERDGEVQRIRPRTYELRSAA